jgi:hypothetical protein
MDEDAGCSSKGSYEKVNQVSVEQILRAQEAVREVIWMRKLRNTDIFATVTQRNIN